MFLVLGFVILGAAAGFGYSRMVKKVEITNFQQCSEAGNPVMESYPRQCRAGNKTYTEEVAQNSVMTEAEAKVIAEATCVKGGETLTSGYYNENSRTWWFDANLNSTKPGCNPACVVSEETKTAEINWRCTGLLTPDEPTMQIFRNLFVDKYPKYAGTLAITITQETSEAVRGMISFETGQPGGIFLGAKTEDGWQIVFEGNGNVDCEKMRQNYSFSAEMFYSLCD